MTHAERTLHEDKLLCWLARYHGSCECSEAHGKVRVSIQINTEHGNIAGGETADPRDLMYAVRRIRLRLEAKLKEINDQISERRRRFFEQPEVTGRG